MTTHKTTHKDDDDEKAETHNKAHREPAPKEPDVPTLEARVEKLEASVRSLVDIVQSLKGSGYHTYDVTKLD